MVRSTSLDPNLGPRADGPHGSLEMLCKPGNDLRLKQRGFTAKTPWIPLHLHRCWSEVALWGWNREASQPKRSRNLSFHLICAGEKWLTFFSCVPHLDSELPVYPAVCSMTACTPGAPRLWQTHVSLAGSGSQPCPQFRITWGGGLCTTPKFNRHPRKVKSESPGWEVTRR